jgi:type II secretory pathway pseudopilin PulG
MKRLVKTVIGVTLLEVMLVLAIAALIIVMSVRYYQSASTSQEAAAFLSQIQAVAAAMNSMSQSTGNYSGLGSSNVIGILPPNGLVVPWGSGKKITIVGSATNFVITATSVPAGICALITRQLTSSQNWTVAGDCSTITYTPAPGSAT